MPDAWLNHVSISAEDLAESTRFYEEVFRAETIPTPNFGFPVQWLRLGDLQLHLFQRPEHSAPRYHHIAFAVDDFAAVFRITKDRGMHDGMTFGHHLYELPGNIAQLYLRDPGGNLVEIDAPNASGLDPAIRSEMMKLSDRFPQDADNLKSTLYLDRRPGVALPGRA